MVIAGVAVFCLGNAKTELFGKPAEFSLCAAGGLMFGAGMGRFMASRRE
jgi:hypothetical protein